MVIAMAALRWSAGAIVIITALSGCSDSGGVSSESGSHMAGNPESVTTPWPSRPPWQCPATYGLADVLRIVEGGEAVALAEVSVDGPATVENSDPTKTTSLDGVSSFKVLAGSLPAGTLSTVRETTGESGQPLLKREHYLLFLGRRADDQAGVYYLAAGATGAFRYTADDSVTPLCAGVQGYPSNGSTTPLQVSVPSLVDLASQAFASLPAPSASS